MEDDNIANFQFRVISIIFSIIKNNSLFRIIKITADFPQVSTVILTFLKRIFYRDILLDVKTRFNVRSLDPLGQVFRFQSRWAFIMQYSAKFVIFIYNNIRRIFFFFHFGLNTFAFGFGLSFKIEQIFKLWLMFFFIINFYNL